MAKLHVLACDDKGVYRGVVHYATPAGSNSVGVSWKAAALAAGLAGTTSLVEGTGPGQITTAEKAQVVAGDVIEIPISLVSETVGGAGAEADAAISNHQRHLAKVLKYFGFTIA